MCCTFQSQFWQILCRSSLSFSPRLVNCYSSHRKNDPDIVSDWTLHFAAVPAPLAEILAAYVSRSWDRWLWTSSCIRGAPSSAEIWQRLVDDNSPAAVLNFKTSDAHCNSNFSTHVFSYSSGDSKGPTCTSRMNALILSSTLLIANDNKFATDERTYSMTTEHTSRRIPCSPQMLALLHQSELFFKSGKFQFHSPSRLLTIMSILALSSVATTGDSPR